MVSCQVPEKQSPREGLVYRVCEDRLSGQRGWDRRVIQKDVVLLESIFNPVLQEALEGGLWH